jgi:hypothetical protein
MYEHKQQKQNGETTPAGASKKKEGRPGAFHQK